MAEKSVKDYDKFMLRFPDGMRDTIAERAKANGRSMNSEIILILRETLERDEVLTSEHSDVLVDVDESEMEFYSLPRDEQIRLIGEFDPLQAEIEKISDYYSGKMKDDVFNVIRKFSKKPE